MARDGEPRGQVTMVVVLDTNHFGEYMRQSAAGSVLRAKLRETRPEVFTTIITSQETAQGWFAWINRQPPGREQVHGYQVYQQSLESLAGLGLLGFDGDAAELFEELNQMRLRIGTMDLKIASICLAHDVLLLSRNLRDFEKVPGLKVENWLD